jgi:hypothetical protein
LIRIGSWDPDWGSGSKKEKMTEKKEEVRISYVFDVLFEAGDFARSMKALHRGLKIKI